jgi:hypothetical protein
MGVSKQVFTELVESAGTSNLHRFKIVGNGGSLQTDMAPSTQYEVIPAPPAGVIRTIGTQGAGLIVRNESVNPITIDFFFEDGVGNQVLLDSDSVSAGSSEIYFDPEDYFFFGLKAGDGGIYVSFTGGDVTGVSVQSYWADVEGIERHDTVLTTTPVSILPAAAAGECLSVLGCAEGTEQLAAFLCNFDLANGPAATVTLTDGVNTVPLLDDGPYSPNNGRENLFDFDEGVFPIQTGWSIQASVASVGALPIRCYTFFSRSTLTT